MNDSPQTTDPRLVEKLQARTTRGCVGPGKWAEYPDVLCQMAAEEIVRLRAKVEELEQLHG